MSESGTEIHSIAERAREAARVVATLPTETKNRCLSSLTDSLVAHADAIIAANARDVDQARAAGLPAAKIARLTLTRGSIEQMAEGVRRVVALPDPVGEVVKQYRTLTGLDVRKVRSPLGVILMIYEARPNVTIDAFALCFKSGNACILKGGREATQSNATLARLAAEALERVGVTRSAIAQVSDLDRTGLKQLLQLNSLIDLVIPRGGRELIEFVHEHTRIPTVLHFQGVCHIFVDESANLDRAVELCLTAKTSAPATCNAVEAILVHERIAGRFVPRLVEKYRGAGVEVRGDEAVCRLARYARSAAPDDWGREFLDLIVAMKVVPNVEAAIEHIDRHGSHHTEAILTGNDAIAARFVERVDASCVLVNASTRFNDGFQLGLGAEIGISTSKTHAYGPMGLEELTTQRYVVRGDYQSR